jgi:pyridoxamine 5'-phosphate oxidase
VISNPSDNSSGNPAGGEHPDLARMRRDYGAADLDTDGLAGTWVAQFDRWLREAVAADLPEPNAMVVATADPTALPSARTVLLKEVDERGFVFYTNYESRKGTELAANPHASLVFPWFPIRRQVVVCGAVEPVSREQTGRYWDTRPIQSQWGAWASPQSRRVADRQALDRLWQEAAQRYPPGRPVPVPEHWGGLRVVPETVEFWQGRTGRLHDRLRYRRTEGGWLVERLAP